MIIELIQELIKNPSVYSTLIIIIGLLVFLIWKLLSRKYNLEDASFEETVNQRAKELINTLSSQVNKLDEKVDKLKTSLEQEHLDNVRLSMLNAIILSNKMIIKGVPYWIFSYPDNKAVFISVEYGELFLNMGDTITDFINHYNSFIHNTTASNEYDDNNRKAVENGVWFGFETIIKDGVDISDNYLIIKFPLKDISNKVIMTMGFAIDLQGKDTKLYLKQFIETYNKTIQENYKFIINNNETDTTQ